MSYTPTTWAAGDTVTAAKLNKIEQGIASGGGVLVVTATFNEYGTSASLDKTWQEIHDADTVAIVKEDPDGTQYMYCSYIFTRVPLGGGDTEYIVRAIDFNDGGNGLDFITNSTTGYPSWTYEE